MLLLDIVIPNLNGDEIVRSLKLGESIARTPVVRVSSKNRESDRVWGRRQGPDVTVVRQFVK